VKSLNSRKAGKEGHCADVIAESNTRLVLSSRLRRRGDKQSASVYKMLEKLKETNTSSWAGSLVTMDRGYVNPEMVETCTSM
jgi:hypothetical protein